MLTQKKLKAVVPQNEFSVDVISWLANDSQRIEATFKKKFPRTRNKFNILLKNKNGTTRTLVVNSQGDVKFFKGDSYKNALSWQIARVLGCPSA